MKKFPYCLGGICIKLACERRRIFGGDKRQPEIRLRSQASIKQALRVNISLRSLIGRKTKHATSKNNVAMFKT